MISQMQSLTSGTAGSLLEHGLPQPKISVPMISLMILKSTSQQQNPYRVTTMSFRPAEITGFGEGQTGKSGCQPLNWNTFNLRTGMMVGHCPLIVFCSQIDTQQKPTQLKV